METDGDLLSRYVRHRAEDAFAALVQRHVNLVYRAALRQCGGDPHRAEETTQIVFTLLARKASHLARHPSLGGWLYTTTHFTVSDLRRREYARQRREREAHAMHETSKATTTEAEWARLRPVLDDAMQQLGERDREALLARFFEGRSFRDVGARIAVGEDAARMRVERALEKLRALLARRGVTSTSSALGLMLANEAAVAAPAGLAASVTGSALAGAAVSAGAAAGPMAAAIHFMSTSKIIAGAAGLLLVGSVGVSVREFRQASAEEAALARARAEAASLPAQIRELNRQAETVASEASAFRQALTAVVAGSSAAGNARIPGPSVRMEVRSDLNTPETLAAGQALLAKHPEARRALDASQRAAFERHWAPRFAAIQLSAEENEAIYREFARLWPMVLRVSGEQAWMNIERPQDSRELDPFIRELVGEVRFQRYQESFRSSLGNPIPDLVRTLAGATSDLDAPLTPQQAEAVQQILQQNPARNPNVWLQPTAPEWAAVRPQLANVLSPEQLARLDLVRESHAANSRRFGR